MSHCGNNDLTRACLFLGLCGLLVAPITAICLSQQPEPRTESPRTVERQAWPPTDGTTYVFVDLSPVKGSPEDVAYLSRSSEVVVDAMVERVSTRTQGHHLETDAVLRVKDVLKGSSGLSLIEVGERGGTLGNYREVSRQYSVMQEGERYILFLKNELTSGLGNTEGGQTRRYNLNRSYHGKFLIDVDQKVHVSPGMPSTLKEFDGVRADQLIAAVRSFVGVH